ncbi:MAG: hypothetical protein J4G15_06980 [Alphaproteobacteria bacterium]|nr:hypothetical protein [Alphaproteobacteria bacterium]
MRSRSWSDWIKNGGDIPWLQYSLPPRTMVTRCTDSGRNYKNGTHLRLDLVPSGGRSTASE